MNVETKKILFIEEYLKVTNEEVIEKLSVLLRKERHKAYKGSLKPMTKGELDDRLLKSEKDIHGQNIFSQEEVEQYFKRKMK